MLRANYKLKVEQGIVCQIVDGVKTQESEQDLHVGPEVLEVLKAWKQATQFSANEDWIFASPVQIGRLPWSYDQVYRVYQKAAKKRGGSKSAAPTLSDFQESLGMPPTAGSSKNKDKDKEKEKEHPQ